VLIVDDSRLLRRALRAFFETSPDFVVVGEAATGRDAVAKVASLQPDLVTMDLEMPDLDGLGAIERIMAERPTPILVLTGDPEFRGLNAQFEALARGAIDLLEKPSDFPGTPEERRHFLSTALLASRVPVVHHVRGAAAERRARRRVAPGAAPRAPVSLVVMAASTGGPGAIRAVLAEIGADRAAVPPIVVVQHMHAVFAAGFVEWLRASTRLRVREAARGVSLDRGSVYVAVRGDHVAVTAAGELELRPDPAVRYCPSADVLFESAADAYGAQALGVLLSGMGDDGAAGLAAIAAAGGLTIAQDEETSAVFGMPGAAVERGAARLVLPVGEIAGAIRDATLDKPRRER
jgi:two-component system chemotaxis response regulator CheB